VSGARIQLKRSTAASWTSNNPVLYVGEIGFETDTNKLKIGDGSTAWTSLSYTSVPIALSALNDLGDVTITSAADGDFLRWNGTAWINDAVNLSTDTIGSYVASLVAGTGVTLTNNSGEGATPTVAVTANTFDAFGAASTAATNAATALTNHEADTTSIHGIADTSILVTTTGSQTLTNKTITSPSGLVKGDVGLGNVDNTSNATERAASATLTNKTLTSPVVNTPTGIVKGDVGLGSVDNTSDTAKPVSTAQQTALDLKAPLASPTFTGTVAGITATMVGLGSVNNTADTAKPVSTAQQTALDLKAPLASPTLTGTPIAPTAAAGNNSTQIATTAYADAAVAALVGTAGATLDTLGEIATALGNDVALSTTLTTSIGLKAPLASPTFTGTVSGITATMVGLGSVDNTADTAKPVSTAQQTALDLKAPLASPSLTGTPLAPTAAGGTNTTQIATTAFVVTALSGASISALNDVADVTITSAANGDLLKWNGTAWVNAAGYALNTAVRDSLIQLYMEVI